MRIKSKIAFALVVLFGAMVTIVGLSLFYLRQLSTDAKNILKDNYESLEYTKRIVESCDLLSADSTRAFDIIETNILLQSKNITEPGELELTHMLQKSYEKLRVRGFDQTEISDVRNVCLSIQELNMQAIIKKNDITHQTADQASTYLIIIGVIISVVAFTFVVNFPGYIGNPIAQLTSSIKSIANKDYEERLRFDRKDEFGELAEAFNLMAEKLDEYEHSNLEKLLSEKKRIETIINRMSDPVIGLDEDKRVIFANDQALHLLNLNQAQTIGRYAPDIAVENDLFRNLIRTNMEEVEPSANLIKIVIDGKENYFTKEITKIHQKSATEKESMPVGSLILLKNVTPFKELDLAKTNFIATISHELKTPIASLLMGIKLLHNDKIGSLNAEQLNIIQTLGEETTRLSKITHELLDLAQVETGNIKLNRQNINPLDIIQYALEAVKFHAERKKVLIDVKAPPGLPMIKADMEKTTWVLVNLLTNAIRYSPENEKVTLTCTPVNHSVQFSVKDLGPGIEARYVNRLFEKFFQVPGSPSGTGLGLAISKEFIEAQDGEIQVESEPGKGSTFAFRLSISEV